MEVAFSLLGAVLGLITLLLAYIWRSNGQLHREMMGLLREIMAGLERINQGQERIAEALTVQSRILERIEARL